MIEEAGTALIDCTTIYASILDDDGYATSKMNVGEARRISVMYVQENTTIDKTCTFVSGDASILTVDDTGLVTAKSAGKSYVTVTASNGLTAICSIEVRGAESKLVGFELAWGSKWEIETYYAGGVGCYSYDWSMMGAVSTVIREIGEDSGYMLLTPRAVYSDRTAQIILPESFGAYKFSFTSSDPSLVTVSADSSIIVHRVIGANEGPRTVTIAVYSGYFETSKTVTITLYSS